MAQHRRAIEADADCPPAHCRIVFCGVRQVGQYLVAADIQGAKDHRTVLGLIEYAPIELGLLVDAGKAVPHHERDLGAKEPDALGPRRLQLRQVDQQPGIQQQLDLDAVESDGWCRTQGAVEGAAS